MGELDVESPLKDGYFYGMILSYLNMFVEACRMRDKSLRKK